MLDASSCIFVIARILSSNHFFFILLVFFWSGLKPVISVIITIWSYLTQLWYLCWKALLLEFLVTLLYDSSMMAVTICNTVGWNSGTSLDGIPFKASERHFGVQRGVQIQYTVGIAGNMNSSAPIFHPSHHFATFKTEKLQSFHWAAFFCLWMSHRLAAF